MQKKAILLSVDELIELEPGTLTGTEVLSDLPGWNSLTVLGFIALADEKFAIAISAKRLANCKAVNDLIDLLDSPSNS